MHFVNLNYLFGLEYFKFHLELKNINTLLKYFYFLKIYIVALYKKLIFQTKYAYKYTEKKIDMYHNSNFFDKYKYSLFAINMI